MASRYSFQLLLTWPYKHIHTCLLAHMPLHNVCSPFLHHCLFACFPVSLDQASATAKSGTGNKLSIQDCGDAEILMYKQANRAGGHCCKLLLLLFISTLSLLNNKNFLEQNGNLEEGWLDGCTNDLEMKRLSTNDLTVCIFLSFPLVKSNTDTHTRTHLPLQSTWLGL